MSETRERSTALVTGAGTRVGRRIAQVLSREGFDLAIHYHSSRAEALDLAREIRAAGKVARVYRADLSRRGSAERLAAAVLRNQSPVALLVNSASVWIRTPIGRTPAEAFDRLMAINLRSPFILSVILGGAMKRRGAGVIINLLDWSLDRPYPDYVAYGITKAGLAAATRGLARALAPEVRVNAVAPGAVLLPRGIRRARADAIRRAVPLGRIGSPDDVAEAIAYLARAPYATGTILTIDGGRSTR